MVRSKYLGTKKDLKLNEQLNMKLVAMTTKALECEAMNKMNIALKKKTLFGPCT